MGLAPLTIEELLGEGRDHRCRGYGADEIWVRIAAAADLPTRFGPFQVVAFWNDRDGKEHAAFVKGDPTDAEGVPVRVHSECLTGDASAHCAATAATSSRRHLPSWAARLPEFTEAALSLTFFLALSPAVAP